MAGPPTVIKSEEAESLALAFLLDLTYTEVGISET
jgi:hypothetical protein